MGIPVIYENFNNLAVPAVPVSGSFTDFESAYGIGVDLTIGLKRKIASTAGRGEFAVNSGSANASVSINLGIGNHSRTDNQAIDNYLNLYCRSTAIGGAQTCYAVQMRAFWRDQTPDDTLADTVNGFSLVKFIADTPTPLGSGPVLPSTFTSKQNSANDSTVDSSYGQNIAFRVTLEANGSAIKGYVQRPADMKYLKPDGTWQTALIACLSATDSSIPGSATDKAGFSFAASPNSTTPFYFDNFEIYDLNSPVIQANGTAYVETTGNNNTAVVGNKNLPFATIDRALDAVLPGSPGNYNRVKIGKGRFGSLSTQKLKEYLILEGSGQRGVASIDPTGRSVNDANATIIEGNVGAFRNNITFKNFCIDYGFDVVNGAKYGGINADTFNPCSVPYQNPINYPKRTNVQAYSITALNQAGTTNHCVLFEGADSSYLQDITGIFGFAMVSKCSNSTHRQWNGYGQGVFAFYAPVIKTNAYSPCNNSVFRDFYSAGFTGTGTNPQTQGPGHLDFNKIGDGRNTTGQVFPDLFNITFDGYSITGYGGAAAVFTTSGAEGTIHDVACSNVVVGGGTSLGSPSGTNNTLTAAAATVTAVNLSFNAGTYTASAACSPGNAPQYVRFSVDKGYIDSFTGVYDATGVASGATVTVTARSVFGANAAVVQSSTTFSAPVVGSSTTVTSLNSLGVPSLAAARIATGGNTASDLVNAKLSPAVATILASGTATVQQLMAAGVSAPLANYLVNG